MLPVRPCWRLALVASWLTAAIVVAQEPAQPPAPQPGLPAAGAKQKAPEWPTSIGGKSATEWVAEFTNPDPTLRENAVKVIPGFGPDVRKIALKPLIAVIRDDSDPGVLVNATLVIATIGFTPEHKDDLAAAISALRSRVGGTRPGSVYRLHGARALASFGTESHAAIPTLIAIADDTSWETRAAVATALGRAGAPIYGPPPKGAQPPVPQRRPSTVAMDRLKLMISDPSGTVRMEAVQGMLSIGPPYVEDPSKYPAAIEPYVKVVQARIKSEEKEKAIKVWLLTLHCMYDDRVMDANADRIADFTTHDDPALAIHALNALVLIGSRGKATLPIVKECLKSKEPAVVANAIETMIAIGEEHRTTAILELDRLAVATPDKDMKKFYESASTALRAGKKEFDPKANEKKP